MGPARPTFDIRRVLREARGLNTDGHAILTKGFAREIEEELDRLYQLEDFLFDQIGAAKANHPAVLSSPFWQAVQAQQ